MEIPILLLKTRSTPSDNYESYFTSSAASSPDHFKFAPQFIPVMKHRMNPDPILEVIRPNGTWAQYGGLIFTSQRAVEAFDSACRSAFQDSSDGGAGAGADGTPHAGELANAEQKPFYAVGPATSAAIQEVANRHFALRARMSGRASAAEAADYPVLGKDAGNGQALAGFILDTYESGVGAGGGGGDITVDAGLRAGAQPRSQRRPLCFFVGEQRRDVIPKTLMSEDLPVERRVRVDEKIVYETAVEDAFESQLRSALLECERLASPVWIVVFSPTGCDAMLSVVGWTKDGGWPAMTAGQEGRRKFYIATIGPTTRDHLITTYGFAPDVCAAKPSPEGVGHGIQDFMRKDNAMAL